MFRCIVSGSGKVALHVVEKLISVGAVPITISGKPFNFSLNYALQWHEIYSVISKGILYR